MPSGPSAHGIPLNQSALLQPTPIPTPSHPSGGLFSIAASTTIRTSALCCVAATLDTQSYVSWNRFVPEVNIITNPPISTSTSAPGSPSLSSPASASDAAPGTVTLDPALEPLYAQTPALVRPGTQMVFRAAVRPCWPRSSTKLVVQHVVRFHDAAGRTGWRVVWGPRSPPAALMWSERVQEFVETQDDAEPESGVGGARVKTEYTTWETFGGLAAYPIKAAVGKDLIVGFDYWAEDLRKEAERRENEEGV
ncbi:hypothetical protein BROUX41_002571 [Berkeleyomyces rouxiae]